jgi:murein L,D-transpeptidase YafK
MIGRSFPLVAWLALATGFAAACARPVPPAPPPPQALPAPPPPPECRRIVRIEVRKQERVLEAHCEGGAVVKMTAAMGREPLGHKVAAGDLRTPEGWYRVSGPAEPGRFHVFIPIDYPSERDARLALRNGRISERHYRHIARAHQQGLPPPSDTPLGGGLGFHGEGARWEGDSVHLDWTYGCIAVTDPDIDFLSERLSTGTPVVILP